MNIIFTWSNSIQQPEQPAIRIQIFGMRVTLVEQMGFGTKTSFRWGFVWRLGRMAYLYILTVESANPSISEGDFNHPEIDRG